jgi:hypothetical protein
MKGNATRRKDAEDWSLNRSDLAILSAVARLHYLTAAQVSRLVFPGCHDEDRYARRRLARLVDAGLLLRLKPLALPHRGAAPHVFTLAHAGRRLLGLPTGSLRPGEEQSKARNLLFIAHTLATIDVVIAAELLCRTSPVAMPRLLTERELKAHPTRVELAGTDGRARSVAVIPDAWFELAVGTKKPVAIAIELDRGSEDQKRWRGKVAALAGWALGPYREAFGNETLTIAVVTPDEARRDQLRVWTAQELDRIGQRELEIFLFTAVDPVATSPQRFFFRRCWYEPVTPEPVSLLIPPTLSPSHEPSTDPSVSAPMVKEVWRAGG